MRCKECSSVNTRVLNTEHLHGAMIRYLRCLECRCRFKTKEMYLEYDDAIRRHRIKKEPTVSVEHQVKGEAVHTSVLTEANVKDIRSLYATGYGYTMLAVRYGVNASTIRRIVQRKSWKHVP